MKINVMKKRTILLISATIYKNIIKFCFNRDINKEKLCYDYPNSF